MIDHLGISVRNHAESKAFYLAALAPLGIGVAMAVSKEESGAPSDYSGFGSERQAVFLDRRVWRHRGCGNASRVSSRRRASRWMSFIVRRLPGALQGQWGAGDPRALPPELLRRVRHRLERHQSRSGVPRGLTTLARKCSASPPRCPAGGWLACIQCALRAVPRPAIAAASGGRQNGTITSAAKNTQLISRKISLKARRHRIRRRDIAPFRPAPEASRVRCPVSCGRCSR